MLKRTSVAVFLLLSLTGCGSIPSVSDRTRTAQGLAQKADWSWGAIDAGGFRFAVSHPVANSTATPASDSSAHRLLTIYIEGDGLAWVSSSRPSLNPTPMNPLALKLALKDPSGSAAYLGRPCQYFWSSSCGQKYWTSARFAPEVIKATSLAIDQLRERSIKSNTSESLNLAHQPEKPQLPEELHLVGYSGGAAIALLVAAQRTDVTVVTTIAGNLDHVEWTQRLKLTPLTGSLNPPDFATRLKGIAQTHWIGGRDRVVPAFVAQSYQHKLGRTVSIRPVADYDHVCCWAEDWSIR